MLQSRSSRSTSPSFRAARRVTAAGALALLLLAVSLLAAAPAALAKSYSIPDCTISSQIAPNGDLSVDVRQTFSFSGSFSTVYWTLPKKGSQGIEIEGVRGPSGQLTKTAPGDRTPGTYSVADEGSDIRVEAHEDLTDTTATFVLAYRALGAAIRWADTAELYWQFIGAVYAVPMEHVRVVVDPPPAVTSKSQVKAWAHGPLWGNVSIGQQGSVLATVSPLPDMTFLEVRMTFPAAALSAAAPRSESRLPTILSEEQAAADQANSDRAAARAAEHRKHVLRTVGTVVGGILAAAGILFYIVMYRRFGREYTPSLPGEYYRDIPGDLPPAVIQYLWKTGSIDDKAIPATLLDLANKGVVRIDQVSEQERGLFGDKQATSYRLTLDRSKTAGLDPSASDIVALLFDLAGDGDSLVIDDLREFAKHHKREFAKAHADWKKTATKEAEGYKFFDAGATTASRVVAGVGLLLILAPALTAFLTGTWWMLVPVPVGIGLIAGANAIKRRSVEANELYAKYHGLYRYMKDFGRLQEKPPTAVVLWEQYLVLATLFGIADQVIRDMKVAVPEVVDDPAFRNSYWWIAAPLAGQHPFTAAFSQSMTAAVAASTASSGSGAGGGFSGGGGGGGGGMGGGAF